MSILQLPARRSFCLGGSILSALVLRASSAPAAAVPDDCTQLIVGIDSDWNSIHGKLRLFERDSARAPWRPVGPATSVLFGKTGLAWGNGIAGQDEKGLRKTERDGRAPAGIFRIGKIYTYDAQLPPGADFPFHQVTRADAWIDDVRSSNYNKFVTIPEVEHPPPWFEKQKMRHGDFAYRWLVEIRHNSDPPQPGQGSAIFFHIRRGVNRPTAGCTTMAENDLVRLIQWLRAPRNPCYVLLPAEEYKQKWEKWRLPSPDEY